jgi:hypothetical protein
MVNNHEFVQEAVYTNGKYKPPSFICYAKTQFEDMKPHLQSDTNCTFGVDRTFTVCFFKSCFLCLPLFVSLKKRYGSLGGKTFVLFFSIKIKKELKQFN